MFESPFVFALAFFGLGFIAGIIVAVLFQAARSGLPGRQAGSERESLSIPSPTSMEPISQQVDDGEQAQAQPEGGVVRGESTPPQETVTWVRSLTDEPAVQPEHVRASPIESFLHIVRSSTIREQAEPKTMAAEIDAIIQEKLPGSNLSDRSVRIEEQPNFGLFVVVDGEKYAGVNAVPDEAVRSFIQRAVAEWQDRNSSTTPA